MFDILIQGSGTLFSPMAMLMVVLGCALGLIVGVLPGLGPLMGIVVLTPVAFLIDQHAAMALLVAVYVGGSSGGAISAILLRIPGTPLAAATLLDGFPMAEKGKGAEAIGLAIAASAVGGLIGGMFLVFAAPALAEFALNFAPFEYFGLSVLGLLTVAVVSADSKAKGFAAMFLGLFIATIGTDNYTSYARFTLGTDALLGGLHIVAVVVGLFAFSEMFFEIEKGGFDKMHKQQLGRVSLIASLGTLARNWFNVVRSSAIGSVFGALPGAGGAISSFTAYAFAKSNAKPGQEFGKGEPNGVIAAESANNATCGGALIPSLALGVPGDAAAAVLMGALILVGYFPGPTLFENNKDVVGGIFIAYLASNVALLFLGTLLAPLFVFALRIKKQYLIPLIMLFSSVGTYAIQRSIFDLGAMLCFGVLGYLLRRSGYPLAPVVIGLVLGPICEENLRRSLIFSDGNYMVFFDRPISATLLYISAAILVLVLIPESVKAKLKRRS